MKKMGDGILAVFKQPVNAVISALRVQARIAEYNSVRVEQDKFRVRIGLNTGKVIRKDGDVFGPVVNVASRMQSAADPGDILLTESTFSEVKDYVRCMELGKIQVKGVKEAITAYSPEELTVDIGGVTADGEGAAADTPMEKLKQSAFVPEFRVPAGLAGGREVADFLQGLFSDIVKAIEEVASDYHDEYEFKKYLQERWIELLGKL